MRETVECRGYDGECENELGENLMDGGLCPNCAQLRRIEGEIRHDMTRDPTVEPW